MGFVSALDADFGRAALDLYLVIRPTLSIWIQALTGKRFERLIFATPI
jgi:hypothetical protein